ncbi:MAG: PilZ domain-containing protein [Pseudomonadota bacterium]
MTQDRRRYFRYEDTVRVGYRVIQDTELVDERRFIFINEVTPENLHAALAGLELRFQEFVGKIRSRDSELADGFDLLNRKLGLLERVIAVHGASGAKPHCAEQEVVQATISGSGMSFPVDAPLAAGVRLGIDLILLPQNYPMRAIARVVACKPDGDRYCLAVDFEDIKEEDRDVIIQHIVKRQSQEIREQKFDSVA